LGTASEQNVFYAEIDCAGAEMIIAIKTSKSNIYPWGEKKKKK